MDRDDVTFPGGEPGAFHEVLRVEPGAGTLHVIQVDTEIRRELGALFFSCCRFGSPRSPGLVCIVRSSAGGQAREKRHKSHAS
jgi:hypothetical protein